jgi:hypothetical protein
MDKPIAKFAQPLRDQDEQFTESQKEEPNGGKFPFGGLLVRLVIELFIG